ncbi:thrombospondin type 3 repeat-containing protein [Maribacter sp. LLG6340-A2]|uniref:leucine-rich repeat domain-containing protein n=1 Tax=Maribacter sp. LLG6340-A2 TaxID=3160834 RepID=UPI00386553B4
MSKNYTWLYSLALFFVSLTGYSQNNLIANGDFESWSGNEPNNFITTNGVVTRNQTDTSSGSSSVQIFNATTSQDASIQSDSYSLLGGKTYILKLDVKMTFISGGQTNDIPSISIRADNSSGAIGHTVRHQTGTWENGQFVFEVPTNDNYTFTFTIANSSIRSFVQDILIDNIRLYDAAEIPENTTDRNALIALYNATDGANWQNTWDLNESMIYWDGVTQNDNGRVIKIKLRANNVIGYLPPELGNLEELQILDLTKNGFTGQPANNITGIIPPEIGNLTKLKELHLNNFEISGSLPIEMGQMSQLEILYLSYNNLTGSIPSEFGNLANAKRIALNNNQLTGNIPTELGQLNNLTTLNLGTNDLSGTIPSSIGQLSNLEYLGLDYNNLTGTIPTSIGQLQNLTSLKLDSNNLNGAIPTQLSQLSSIQILYLDRNNLSGILPKELAQLTNLERLDLSVNNLEGEIPIEFGNLANLTTLTLNFNNFTGSIPKELGQLSNLVTLFLSENSFSGTIPVELNQIPTLDRISLDRNNFSGQVPTFTNSHSIFRLYDNSFIFEDLLDTSINQPQMNYATQASIGVSETIYLETNDTFEIAVTTTTDTNNTYQWRKDGENIEGATNSTFTIANVTSADIGAYDCQVSNTQLTDLTLTKNPITLAVDGASIIDEDNDGIADNDDQCPDTPEGETVNFSGCSPSQLDDDNDGVTNNLDICRNTPVGEPVDEKGCIIIDPNQTNFLQNFSFENWSGTPSAPDNWSIVNANSVSQANFYYATEGYSSLRLDLSTSISERTELSTRNVSKVSLQKNKAHTFAFDYKVYIGTGESITANLWILKDGGNFATQYINESLTLNTDGEWHTYSFDFMTDTEDEDYVFELEFRATSAPQSVIVVDYMRVLGETPPDEDNDGVTDAEDQCPGTSPSALAVDDNGCEVSIDDSNIINDPSFEDWSLGGGSNLAQWGIIMIPGSSWNKNEDISDNLEYSLELTTSDNGTNTSSIFQKEVQLYKGVSYEIAIDYKITEGSFNTLEFELTKGIFPETIYKVTTDPSENGWNTFRVYFTPESNELVDLNISAISDQPQEHILLDNMVLRANIASTDNDNDGVDNTVDQCPNTPMGESVNANGCSQSQLDDDNDGVSNDSDSCPNTPEGTFVNNIGCPVTQTDTDEDEDGVFDADDLCPNTPTGETVNSNGCSQSQLDDDNDGVNNAIDQCPNTLPNITVNAEGCADNQTSLPDIPNDGIQVKVTSTSCPNTSNGEITVSLTEDYLYQVELSRGALNESFSNITNNEDFVKSNLSPGVYSVCINIPDFPDFKQCFTVTVSVPDEFTTGKTVVDYHAQKARIIVSGSKNYEVLVNDKMYTYQFDDVSNHEILFPLDKGVNQISIETDKICQGIFNDNIVINQAILSPNPVAETLRVEGLDNMNNAQILIANVNGVTAIRTSSEIINGELSMDISNLDPGVYMLTVIESEKEINLKFVKK